MKKSRILSLLLSAAISLTPLCSISASAEESSYSFNICFIAEESEEYVENVNAKLIQQAIEWTDDEHFVYVGDEVVVSEWNTNSLTATFSIQANVSKVEFPVILMEKSKCQSNSLKAKLPKTLLLWKVHIH